MLSRILLGLTALIHLASALPTSTHTHITRRQDDSNTTISESWTIPRLDMHMMSVHTGIPGDQWPANTTFNSTIDFNIIMPNHTIPINDSSALDPITLNCKTSFANGTLPLGRIPCASPSPTEVLFFEMYPYTDLGPRRAELAFWLEMTSAVKFDEESRTAEMYWWGRRAVTANDPKEKSSFLTCLEGRPFDGLRCKIKSYMSVDEELVVGVEKVSGKEEEEEDGGE